MTTQTNWQYSFRRPKDVILKHGICTTGRAIDPAETLTVLLDTLYVGRSKMGLHLTTRVG